MMKNKILVGTVLVGMLSMGQVFASANSLQNATITATYNGLASGMLGVDYLSTGLGDMNVTKLDPTGYSEFITSDYQLTVDFDNAGFVTFLENSGLGLENGTYSMTFDFGSTLTELISGFSFVDASAISATPLLSVLNDHSVNINFTLDATHTWGQLSAATAQLEFATAVPEPGALALLLAGLGVLGINRRFSKKQ